MYYITVSLNLGRQLHELHYYLYNSKIMEMHYMIVYKKLRIISLINVAIIYSCSLFFRSGLHTTTISQLLAIEFGFCFCELLAS